MNSDRNWMYKRRVGGYLSKEYIDGVETFIEFARINAEWKDGDKLKCPCSRKRCSNINYLDIETITQHLMKHGFVPGYYTWLFHGEGHLYEHVQNQNVIPVRSQSNISADPNPYIDMIRDAAGPSFNQSETVEEPPNPEAQRFYDMLKAANDPLYEGCETHSKLSFVARTMNIKSECHISEKGYDLYGSLIKELLPAGNLVTENFYKSKQLLRGMGLPVEKIDTCINNCMIYWGSEDRDRKSCKICDHPRFKPVNTTSNKRKKTSTPYKRMHYFPLTPRLQRLYASNATAADMRCHAEHVVKDDIMHHPSDSMAWKHFNQEHPDFAADSRNVKLGLCTDGFQPFGSFGQQYSSWPVILTPYNLPPHMCMKDQYMFLTVLIPGPKNPKEKIDVFLQPLIAELLNLWENGVASYDISRKQNFVLRATLLWTISDFPAYSMLSGRSTAGKEACPYCMERFEAFSLRCSGKQSWFDNHRKFLEADHPFRRNKVNFRKNKVVTTTPPAPRSGTEILAEIDRLGLLKVTEPDAALVNANIFKTTGWKKRSIFWDLPYWSTNLIRHNLDVMHIEKNVFDNFFNTVMNVKGKTKDTPKSREELNDYCRRPELQKNPVTGKFPAACYCLDKASKTQLCEWLKGLKFPDGYASNLGRCFDMIGLRLIGMKSHDCHVFMQRLIPIAFRDLLPQPVWKALTELSLFFKELCSRSIDTHDMIRLEREIPIILCNLERIFPPSFFDSMEHLPVHLPHEAKIGGPFQYRWMYPFERYLRKLKNNVRNKARVEGSIANAYLIEETATFMSFYFEDHVPTRINSLGRNETNNDIEVGTHHGDRLSCFIQRGEPFGGAQKRFLTTKELDAATIYVLLNSPEVEEYVNIYTEMVKQQDPRISDARLNERLDKEFASWFKEYAEDPSNNVVNEDIRNLAIGPSAFVTVYPGCKVNGYKFHTVEYGSNRTSSNMGVCIRGSSYSSEDDDYYGLLNEVLYLDYTGMLQNKVLMFKCEWFDPTPAGTRLDRRYRLVDINHNRRFRGYEPFVLASQAEQVYYSAYPSTRRENKDWWTTYKIKPRASIGEWLPYGDPYGNDDFFCRYSRLNDQL